MTTFDDLISRMDVSALKTEQRADFVRWLTQRAYLKATLGNALQKGLILVVYVSPDALTGEIGYGLRSQSRRLPTIQST